MYVGYVWKMMMQHMIDDGLVEKLLGEWRESNLLDRGKLPKTWEAYFQKARADLLDALPPELQEPFAAWEAGWYAHFRRVILSAFCQGCGLYFKEHYTGRLEEDPFEDYVWQSLHPDSPETHRLTQHSEKAFLESAQWILRIRDEAQRSAVAEGVRRLNKAWKARERGVAGAAFCVGYHNGMVSCLDRTMKHYRPEAIQENAGMAGAFSPERTDPEDLEF